MVPVSLFIVAIVPNDAAITLRDTVPKVGCNEISAYVLGGKCIYFSVTHTPTHAPTISYPVYLQESISRRFYLIHRLL